MTSSMPSSPEAKPGTPASVLGLVRGVIVIATGIGIVFLPQPYYAIGQVVLYLSVLALIVAKLRSCLRIAKGSEYHPMVYNIVIFVVFSMGSVGANLGSLFRTEARDFTWAPYLALYCALICALALVELLLKRSLPGTAKSAV